MCWDRLSGEKGNTRKTHYNSKGKEFRLRLHISVERHGGGDVVWFDLFLLFSSVYCSLVLSVRTCSLFEANKPVSYRLTTD